MVTTSLGVESKGSTYRRVEVTTSHSSSGSLNSTIAKIVFVGIIVLVGAILAEIYIPKLPNSPHGSSGLFA